MYKMLKRCREEKNYTCKDMARMLKISPAYYSQIENQKRKLYYYMAVKISSIFELMPDDIFYNYHKNDKVRFKVRKQDLIVKSYFKIDDN